MIKFLKSFPRLVSYDNSLDAWVPEVWAQETLAILEENMVIGNMVYREFSNEIKNFGDTVNTRLPGTFTAARKGVNDEVSVQAASATNVPVVLNQHIHTSFMIRDGEESLSFQSLVQEYLRPAALSIAQAVDKILLGQVYQFLDHSYGTAGGLDATTAPTQILGIRNVLNLNLCPVAGRIGILTPTAETAMLSNPNFFTANTVGDAGTAMREASLGRKFGIDWYMCQNASSVALVGTDIAAMSPALTTAVAKGDLQVTGTSHTAIAVGQFLTIGGHPYRCTAQETNKWSITPAARQAYATTAPCILSVAGAVALTEHTSADPLVTAYPAGWAKTILVDGTGTPHVGQKVAFTHAGTAYTAVYTIISVASNYITLDRPLEDALANNDVVNYGPTGEFNLVFTQGAIAFVNRPLALPRAGTGASAGVANYNNLALRTVITYDGKKQGHLVTLDMLAGVKVLNDNLAGVLIG